MRFICGNKECEHCFYPCELSEIEMNNCFSKGTPCPVGDYDYFYDIYPENTFACLVVGSRTFNDYNKLSNTLDKLLQNKTNKDIIIVSGGANGADSLAERYAKEHNYKLIVFRADWNTYGNSAGYKRNDKMHQFIATFDDRGCVAFWDGVSKGTAHNFELAKKYCNTIKTIRI